MSDSLDRAVDIVDRLRSPGGCPWDREQTHKSLSRYLLEESYETVEAIETDDYVLLREELGDLLLQILLHARLAQEAAPERRFTLDDVADDLAEKMVRRHPHVFAGAPVRDSAQVNDNWERLKSAEKQRTSVTDGVPLGQPSLSLAAKLVARVGRSDLAVGMPPTPSDTAADRIGRRLFDVVSDAVQAGVDPETALRETTRGYRQAILSAEQAARAADWTGMIERTEPPYQGDERQTLLGFLDYQRQTLAWKCEGLSAEQLARRSMPPSTLSLLGLVRHLADVEHGWFHEFAGLPVEFHYSTADDPDRDIHGGGPDDTTVQHALDAWHTEIAHSNEVAAAHDLDDSYVRVRGDWSGSISLRWLLVHMIEEYARHNGHADLLREAIDGAVGE